MSCFGGASKSLAIGAESFQNNALKTRSALLINIAQYLATHPRIPEILQMVRDALRSFGCVRFRLKEGRDVVGHFNQLLNIHDPTKG